MSENIIYFLKMVLTVIIVSVSIALFKLSKDYLEENNDEDDE